MYYEIHCYKELHNLYGKLYILWLPILLSYQSFNSYAIKPTNQRSQAYERR